MTNLTASPPAPGSVNHVEIEWQFEAADLPPVEAWLRTHALEYGFALAPAPAADQTDIYLDTDDWRFYRAGYALRLRRMADGMEAALKALARAQAGAQYRREISERLGSGRLEALLQAPGEVGEHVRAVAGSGGLRPIFALQTHRCMLSLVRETAPLAEVALDETRILLGAGQEPVRLRRVEVEAKAASPAELEALVGALQAGCGLQSASISKYEAGLAAHGLKPAPPLELGPEAIQDSFTVSEVAWAVMRRNWAAFWAHEPGARLGDNPEAVHDMRVASRRLRAALSLFADCLPARAARFRDELKWVAGALGAVRDVDVQLERMRAWQAEAGPAGGEALAPLAALLEAQHRRARKRMLSALDSHRYARFARAYTAMLQSGPPKRARHAVARLPVVEVAPGLIADRYDQARKAGDSLTETSPPPAYHALRIRGKWLRYTLEFVTEVYGEPARDLARKVTALQDVLGLLQDAQVATAQMRALSETYSRRLPPHTLFAMGEIAQRYTQSAADCRKRFPDVYVRMCGKSWKKLRQAMEARLAPPPETG